MVAEREERLDEAVAGFLEAFDVGSPFDRGTWLETYSDVRDELNKFLADHDRFHQIMAPLRTISANTPAPDGMVTLGEPFSPGRIIGDFQLLEELGRGGMGVVYKARQVSLGRIVALKMIRAGVLASADDVRRFQRETEIVARLDHPNIVPIFQTGIVDGLNFFSMKLIDGGTLADHRAEFHAAPQRAARLLTIIARAVDFAHRHGVLHRDLKPANILLGDGPEAMPHITDFGLAKSGDGDAMTASNTTLGTPAYMAPEQATGEAVSTSADIYSLGAILYELLVGRPPFRGETPFGTLMEAIGREPIRPRHLATGIDRDLETVCLKCLEKEPSRRYESASALADDLDRWLRHEPVRARPVGLLGRAARWTRRHPVPAGLSFALVIAVVAGLAVAGWQWRRAERGLVAANQHNQRAEEGLRDAREMLDEFCNRLSDDRLSKLPGTGPLRQEMLQSGLRYYQRFLEQRSDDPQSLRDVADAHFRLGAIRAALANKPAARDEYRQAMDHYNEILRLDPTADRPRRMAVKTLINYGTLLWDAAQTDDAVAAFRRADELVGQLLIEHPNEIDLLKDRSATLTDLGLLLKERGDAAAGQAALADAHILIKRVTEVKPADAKANADLGRSYMNVAGHLSAQGRHREELAELQKAKACLDEAANAATWDSGILLTQAEVHRALGGAFGSLGRADDAEAEYRQCHAMLESLVRSNPEIGSYRAALAATLNNIGSVHLGRKRYAEAQKAYEEAVAMQSRLLDENPNSRRLLVSQGQTLHNLGNLCLKESRFDDAQSDYEAARNLFLRWLSREPHDHAVSYYLGGTLNNLADVLQKLDRPSEAIATFAEAIRRERDSIAGLPQDSRYRAQLISSLGNLARAQRLEGETEAAAQTTRERDRLRAELDAVKPK